MFANQKPPQIDTQAVINKLQEKGVGLPCPRCSQLQFSIVGEANIELFATKKAPKHSISDIPSYIPVIILGCNNCGFLIQHAKGPLGLLNMHERSA